jgi:hypothetical protein
MVNVNGLAIKVPVQAPTFYSTNTNNNNPTIIPTSSTSFRQS